MTENTNIIVRGKKSKLSIHINEEKDVNITPKNKKSSIKKKGECSIRRYQKKKNVKQQTKQNNIRQEVAEKLSVPNMFSEYNKEVYEHQIERLKQSLNCPTLTQKELNILFMKYKYDGHFRANKNLPPFTYFADKTCTFNENKQSYDQMQFAPDNKEINTKDIPNTTANSCYNINNENQSAQNNLTAYKNIEASLQTTEMSEKTNMDNKIYMDQNFVYNNNYNNMFGNHDVLGNIQNFSQSKSDKEDHFSCSFMNTEKEHYSCRYTNKNSLYNIFDSNLHRENLNNNAILQPNDTYTTVQYNDLSNPDICNNICLHKRNLDNNNNQSDKNVYSACVPQINDLKSYYNVNNSQVTQIENYFQNEDNFNSSVHTNTYPVMNDKENLVHHFNSNINIQQDCSESANPNVILDNYSTEPNTFPLFCPNVAT